jgi:ABC-type phosphate transport system permease subunit
MRKGFCVLGLVIGLFAYISTAQNTGGAVPVEVAVVLSGIIALAGLCLPVIVVIIVAVNTTRSAGDTISEAARLLKS